MRYKILLAFVVAGPLLSAGAAYADYEDDLVRVLPWAQEDSQPAIRGKSSKPNVVGASQSREQNRHGSHRVIHDHHSNRHGPDFHQYD